jgi:lysophospholipase L1-like esterase
MASTWTRRIGAVLAPAATAAVGLLVALAVTPAVPVTAFGQDLRLGAVAPSAIRGWSGPGQADLFGEGPISTALEFPGPLRPRLVWQRFARDPAATEFVQTSAEAGPSFRTAELGRILAQGWTTYVVALVVLSALISGVLRLAMLGAATAQHRGAPRPARRTVLQVGAAVAAGGVLAGGAAVTTVASARDQLSAVTSLADLTGTAPLVPTPVVAAEGRSDVELVVIGDSTAAGVGNAPLREPGPFDEVCGRSRDAYAEVLAAALRTPTANLACSSATIEAGVLGPQVEGGTRIPPQLGVLKGLVGVRTVVVSTGANDVGWADFIRLCYGLERCDDQLSQQLFASRLDAFRIRYAQLLQQLSALSDRPHVVVLQYYDPFGEQLDCPDLRDPGTPAVAPPGYGFAPDAAHDEEARLRTKIEPLRARLIQLNAVLAEGADAFGFATVAPSFQGHALCDAESWVQGMSARYPFHPDAAGELAMAAALLPVVLRAASEQG